MDRDVERQRFLLKVLRRMGEVEALSELGHRRYRNKVGGQPLLAYMNLISDRRTAGHGALARLDPQRVVDGVRRTVGNFKWYDFIQNRVYYRSLVFTQPRMEYPPFDFSTTSPNDPNCADKFITLVRVPEFRRERAVHFDLHSFSTQRGRNQAAASLLELRRQMKADRP